MASAYMSNVETLSPSHATICQSPRKQAKFLERYQLASDQRKLPWVWHTSEELTIVDRYP